MLVKLVATCLTPEAVKKKLVAEITVSQFEECFPYLHSRRENNKTREFNNNKNRPRTFLAGSFDSRICAHPCDSTHKVVHSEGDIIQDFYEKLLSHQRGDICVPIRQSFPAAKQAEWSELPPQNTGFENLKGSASFFKTIHSLHSKLTTA